MRKLHFLPKGVEHNLPIPAAQKNQKTEGRWRETAPGETQQGTDGHTRPSLVVRGRLLTALETKAGRAENAPGWRTGAAGDSGGQRP